MCHPLLALPLFQCALPRLVLENFLTVETGQTLKHTQINAETNSAPYFGAGMLPDPCLHRTEQFIPSGGPPSRDCDSEKQSRRLLPGRPENADAHAAPDDASQGRRRCHGSDCRHHCRRLFKQGFSVRAQCAAKGLPLAHRVRAREQILSTHMLAHHPMSHCTENKSSSRVAMGGFENRTFLAGAFSERPRSLHAGSS